MPYHHKVRLRRGETFVWVDHRFPDPEDRDWVPFQIASSDWYLAALGEGWDDAVKAAVSQRLRTRRGRAKGRVLYLRAGAAPIAVVGYHVPEAKRVPLEILCAAAADRFDEADSVRYIEPLLDCLQYISDTAPQFALRPRGQLAWVTNNDEAAGEIWRLFDFKGLPKHRHPAGTTAKHYLLRRG